jgi:hypothetical protein
MPSSSSGASVRFSSVSSTWSSERAPVRSHNVDLAVSHLDADTAVAARDLVAHGIADGGHRPLL